MQRRLRRFLMIGITLSWLAGLGSRSAQAAPESAESALQPLAIIVNVANPVENLSMSELRKVFLGERAHWANGRRITLVMMEPGKAERTALIREVCQMNESEFTRHFLHGMFTGEVFVSPKTLSTPTGVRKFVFNVPGAIGYVRPSDVDATVKVLRVDGHLPNDKEYSLRIAQDTDR